MLSDALRQALLNQLAEMPAFLPAFADLPPALLRGRPAHAMTAILADGAKESA